MSSFTESVVEGAAVGWLEALGHQVLQGPDIAMGELAAKRSNSNYLDVMLEQAEVLCGEVAA
jgi:hypothetical protein